MTTMKNIMISDKNISERFKKGDVVFKIISSSINDSGPKDYTMVTANEEYEYRLYQHEYTPLLYIINFPTRLAYLYGCLNHEYMKKKDVVYEFWWREINTNNWSLWFTVYPYMDSV